VTLQDRLNELKKDLAAKVPLEAQAIMQRATAALKNSGQAQSAVRVGDAVQGFTLPDITGAIFRSEEHWGRGPLVVSFYRGFWCPYCNIELQALQETLGEIRARGAELVVISPQSAANSRRSTRVHGLQFSILVDQGNHVASQFGLRFKLPPELIELYKGFGNNLSIVNGDESWTLPMPARFVIDSVGVVRYAEINADYSIRPDPRDLLPLLDTIAQRSQAVHHPL
jgi:peroxiredoxin